MLRKMTPAKLPSRVQLAFVGLLALIFLGAGALSLRETLAVTRSQSIATARVVESRELPTRHGISYEVRYVFSPAAGQPEIGRADFTGRSALWASLPQDLWKVAVATGRLQIRYDPRSPSNNAPVDSLPSIWDSITPLAIGGALAILVAVAARMRHKQAAR